MKVQNLLEYPNSAVGSIISKFYIGDKVLTSKGTGCLIGTNIVLTAAHNVYHVDLEIQSTEIHYTPAPEFPKGTSYRVRKCFVPLQFKTQRLYQKLSNQTKADLYDYALLQLDTEEDI